MRWMMAGLGLKRQLSYTEALDLITPMVESLLELEDEYRAMAEMSWATRSMEEIPGYTPLDWEEMRATDLASPESIRIRVPVPFVGGNPETVVKAGGPYGKLLVVLSNGTDGYSHGRVDVRLFTDDWGERDVERAAGGLLDAMDEAAATRLTGSGYVTWDTAVGLTGSPYEFAVRLNPFHVNWGEYLFGYYWANLLRPSQLAVLRKRGTPPSGWAFLDRGDWAWLKLESPIASCSRDEIRRLRGYVSPLLPSGARTVEEYFEWCDTAGPPSVPTRFYLL